jgi:hypothetical protein
LQVRFFDLLATLTNGIAGTGVPAAGIAFVNVYIKRLAKDPLTDHEITQVGMWMRDVAEALLTGDETDLFQINGMPNLPTVDAAELPTSDELHPHQHAEMLETATS